LAILFWILPIRLRAYPNNAPAAVLGGGDAAGSRLTGQALTPLAILFHNFKENEMKNNHKLGAALSVLGILTGLLTLYLLAMQYNLVIEAKTTAGAIWAAVLYGFLHNEKWAWFWGVVAASIQLLSGFFPAVPAMDSHLPVPTLAIFACGGVLWFSMLFIRGVDKRIITLTFIAGLAYVLTFMDGVAPISKYTTSHDDPFWNGMYVMTQQVSWWGAWAWAVFIFATLAKKSWAIPVGIFAGAMSMIAGYPLGIHNALFEVHRFSMFLPAPLLSTGLVIYLALPATHRMLAEWNRS
jgi:hypothetical protein